jgi:acyl dehydratase
VDRRRFLQWAAASGAVGARSSAAAPAAGTVIDDVSHLNPVRVAAETRPRSTEDVRGALREWRGRVCVGGGRYSMGGQIASCVTDSATGSRGSCNAIVAPRPGASWVR